MAKLKRPDVLHVAKLAKLDLTENETKKFTDQLSNIVDFVGKLSEVDVKNVEPTGQTTGLENIYRQDQSNLNQSLTQEQSLSGTDKDYNGYFKVDALLSERTDK